MGVVGAAGGSADTLHGTVYDSGHEPRAQVMLGHFCGRCKLKSMAVFGYDNRSLYGSRSNRRATIRFRYIQTSSSAFQLSNKVNV